MQIVEFLPHFPFFEIGNLQPMIPAHEGDKGVDLIACEDIALAPGERYAMPCGIRLALPRGIDAEIRPRSGRAFKEGLSVVNTPGTIDTFYRGEIKAILLNTNPVFTPESFVQFLLGIETISHITRANYMNAVKDAYLNNTIQIHRGERIAQLTLGQTIAHNWRGGVVETLTERGEGGFGSTGA